MTQGSCGMTQPHCDTAQLSQQSLVTALRHASESAHDLITTWTRLVGNMSEARAVARWIIHVTWQLIRSLSLGVLTRGAISSTFAVQT